MTEVAPILEFDPDRAALIDPYARSAIAATPRAAVACFFPRLVSRMGSQGDILTELPSLLPLLKIEHEGRPLAVFYPGQGASLCAATVERVLAAGVEAVVACGGAGALVEGMAMGHVVVVESALRDEGTSYHYLPPARTVASRQAVVERLAEVAEVSGSAYTIGRTWTTDGLFRETPGRIKRRREEGCIVVEAEAAALLAVGEFRDVPIGQYLYAGDDVSGAEHDDRDWVKADEVQNLVFRLAAEAALELVE